MEEDAQNKKEQKFASVTIEDVNAILAESIEDRVTPYAKFSYDE